MTPEELVLKRLTLQEMAKAAFVHRTAFDNRLPWLQGLHTPDEDRNFYETSVFLQCEVWGAFQTDLTGIIAFREGWIEQLYILPAFQRQGIGNILLSKAQDCFPYLKLWTFQRNLQARQFYEKHGFKIIEETDGRGNEEKEPDILYQWQKSAARNSKNTVKSIEGI